MDCFDPTELLMELGLVENTVPAEVPYNECCGKVMEVVGSDLLCDDCGAIKAYNICVDNGQNYSASYRTGREFTQFYAHSQLCPSDRVANLVTNLRSYIMNQNQVIDSEILQTTCQWIYEITTKNVKKAKNRKFLIAILIYHASIETKNIMTEKAIADIMGLPTSKFSRGLKFIVNAVLNDRVNIDISAPVDTLYIKKYLRAFNLNFCETDMSLPYQDINTESNRKFCTNMVEVMLERNICYNTTIQSKCIAVVYYLIEHSYSHRGTKSDRKKYFITIAGVGENTFMKIYNTLTSTDVQQIFRDSPKFAPVSQD